MEFFQGYMFTHKESKRIVLPMNNEHRLSMLDDDDYDNDYHRLRFHWARFYPDGSSELCEQMNKFWKGAEGHEKIGKVKCTGITASGMFDGIRMCLKQLHNHACMTGDRDTLLMVNKLDKEFWDDGNASRLLLTT